MGMRPSITWQAFFPPPQTAQAIKYLHKCAIIYRDLKSDNILVWRFPDAGLSLPASVRLGPDTVLVKLSDYGISQFAATQGARGLLGTPGFMAPEILKYHGREVTGGREHWLMGAVHCGCSWSFVSGMKRTCHGVF